jgi:hypothetical protein
MSAHPETNKVEGKIISQVALATELLKISIVDSGDKKINLFVEGEKIVGFFQKLKPGTVLTFDKLMPRTDLEVLKVHLPEPLNLRAIVLDSSDCGFFYLIRAPMDNLLIRSGMQSLEVPQGIDVSTVDLSVLYSTELLGLHIKQEEPSRWENLAALKHSVKKGPTTASCWAILIDCCDSYSPKQPAHDFLVSYKITDPSIYPDFATVNIFHKDPKEMPKIRNLGDILFFTSLNFSEFKGAIQGLIAAHSKTSSFHVFSITDSDFVPYTSYRSTYDRESSSDSEISSLRSWVRSTFDQELPVSIMKNTRRLSSLEQDGTEVDVVARVLEFRPLGLRRDDPVVMCLGDEGRLGLVLLPANRRKLITHAYPGDLVRIRSLHYEAGLLSITPYTEILKITFLQHFPDRFDYSEVLGRTMKAFVVEEPIQHISEVLGEHEMIVIAKIELLKTYPMNSVVGINGYVVKVESGSGLMLTIWDGAREDNLVKVVVRMSEMETFLNGVSWSECRDLMVGYNKMFEAAVRVGEEAFEVVQTRLIVH